MKVILICLTIFSLGVDNIFTNPLLENVVDTGPFARTFSQQNMNCNTRSAFKKITMSSSNSNLNSFSCRYTIRAYSTKVCQLRIDFKQFLLDSPVIGTGSQAYARCTGEFLRINGLDFDLCGSLTNQHVYVPFDVQRLTDEKELTFQLAADSYALWSIETNQIECNHKATIVTPDERQAPEGCLQYFYAPSGIVESFNYGSNYFGNTKYAICFNRNNIANVVLQLTDIKFEMGGPDTDAFDAECMPATPAPVDSTDFFALPFAFLDPDYYSLFCGTSLEKKVLEYKGYGPLVIQVQTDSLTESEDVESGFRFRYRVSSA